MKHAKIICVRGIWLAFSLVLAGVMFGQNGSAQAPGKQAVPEFFGVYLLTDGSLKEIPDVNPEFKKLVASIDPRDEKALLDFMRRFFGICYAANQKPTFVLYHNLVKPEMFSLERVVGSPDGKMKRVAIRLGIAPIEGKNLMYRLIPREELTPGVYEFKTTGEFGTTGYFSCLVVNTTADQWLDSLRAETTSRVLNPPAATPQPTTPPPAAGQRASAQTAEKIPLPEYYGTYAVSDGKLFKPELGPGQLPAPVRVSAGTRTWSLFDVCDKGAAVATVRDISVMTLSADVRFLVFFQPSGVLSPMAIAEHLELVALAYVRNVQVEGCGNRNVPVKGIENAWDNPSISFPMNVKPVPDQPEMVLAVPQIQLPPGLYVLSGGGLGRWTFAVASLSEAERANWCIDVTEQFNPYMFSAGGKIGEKVAPCGTSSFFPTSQPAGQPLNTQPTAPQPSAPEAGICTDLGSCTGAANAALMSSQFDDAAAAWDKILSLGRPLSLDVCHEVTSGCARGTISLGSEEVSFTRNGRKLFAVPPSQVTPIEVVRTRMASRAAFRLRVEGRNYNFDFLPLGQTCTTPGSLLRCPEQGVAQQLAVADYVLATLPKLASGALGPSPAPPAAPSAPASIASESPDPCVQATDLGYSLRSEDGHVYRVKGIGPPGSKQIRVFLDETGLLVQDPSKLQKLARGAWTKELIVDRYNPSSGSGSTGVKAALNTFSSLQGWQFATDLLARATVESLSAIVTGSVSAGARLTQLVWGVVGREFTDPKVALAHWVRAGLEQSLADYTQMEDVMRGLGPSEFKLSDLEKIESLHTAASTLASVSEALGAALAPTTWQDEFTQYLGSAITELMKQPGLKTNATLTLSDVLKLQQYVAGTGQTFTAYKQSLELALRVSQANQLTISEWAKGAARGCGQGTASPATEQLSFAFANASGTALLSAMIDDGRMVPEVNQLDKAVCPNNAVLSIAFDSHQPSGPKDNGRDRSHNFDQREGYKFRVVQGKANEDGSCLITNQSFLLGKQFLSVENEAPPIPCDAQTRSQLVGKQKRGLYSCRQIAQLGTAIRLLVAEFDRRGNDLLAAIVVKTVDRLIVYELPAKFDEQNVTGWRVADDGRIENTRFTSLFALQNESTREIELGVQWEAEEGIYLMLLGSSGGRFQEVYKGYRYTMPI